MGKKMPQMPAITAKTTGIDWRPDCCEFSIQSVSMATPEYRRKQQQASAKSRMQAQHDPTGILTPEFAVTEHRG